MRADDLLSADAFWIINKKLAKEIGLVPTLLLSELLFCRKKFKADEFWVTAPEIEEALGISEDIRRRANKTLLEAGFISQKRKGVPMRWFYTINDQAILDKVAKSENQGHYPKEIGVTIIKKDLKKEEPVSLLSTVEDKPLFEQPTQPQAKKESSLRIEDSKTTSLGKTSLEGEDPLRNRNSAKIGLQFDDVLKDFGAPEPTAVKKRHKSVALAESYGADMTAYDFGRETLHYNRLVKKYGERTTALLLHKLASIKSQRPNWDVPLKWSVLSIKMIEWLRSQT